MLTEVSYEVYMTPRLPSRTCNALQCSTLIESIYLKEQLLTPQPDMLCNILEVILSYFPEMHLIKVSERILLCSYQHFSQRKTFCENFGSSNQSNILLEWNAVLAPISGASYKSKTQAWQFFYPEVLEGDLIPYWNSFLFPEQHFLICLSVVH